MKKILLLILICSFTFPNGLKNANSGYSLEKSSLFLKGLKIYKTPENKRTNDEKRLLKKAEEYFDYEYQITGEYYWEIIEERDDIGDALVIPCISSSTSILGEKYSAKNLYDNSAKTTWAEGAIGQGIGEAITFYFNNSKVNRIKPIKSICFLNGYTKDPILWKENSRIKTLQIYVQGEKWIKIDLKDTIESQVFEIPQISFENLNIKNNEKLTIKMEVLDTYSGLKYEDTCLTEIMFISNIQ